jgi:HK97 family phage major capsid protein
MDENPTIEELIELQKKELGAATTSVKELHNRFKAYDEKITGYEELTTSQKEEIGNLREQFEAAMTTLNRTGKTLDTKEELAQLQVKEFGNWVMHNRDYDQIKFAELGEFETKAMVSDNQRTGGYWMPTTTMAGILEEMVYVDPFRQLASTTTLTEGDTLEGFYEDGTLDAAWTSERGTASEKDTPEIGKWEIPTHPMYVYPKLTQKMARLGSFNVETWLTGKYAKAFGYAENYTFLNGTGVGQPKGILTHVTAGNIAHTSSGHATTIPDFDCLIDIQDSLLEQYQPGASWLMLRSTFTALRKLSDGDAHYILEPDVQVQPQPVLLGKPVNFMYNMPAVGAGLNAVIYGDIKQTYMVVDAPGVFVVRDEISDFGRIILKTERLGVGGDVIDFDAAKCLKIEA